MSRVRGRGLGGDTGGPYLSSPRPSGGPFLSSFFFFGGSALGTLEATFLCALLLLGARPAPCPCSGREAHLPSCPPRKRLPLSPTLVSTSSPSCLLHRPLAVWVGQVRAESRQGRRLHWLTPRVPRPLPPFCDSLLMIVKFLLFLQEGKR